MSGLLVKSTLIMRDNLEELNGRGLAEHPGAARRRRAHPHLRRARPARGLRGPAVLRQGRLRGPARDGPPRRRSSAATPTTTPTGAACRRVDGARSRPLARPGAERRAGRSTLPARSPEVETDNPVFVPPFLGSKVVKGIPLDDIAGLHQRDGAVPQPVAVPAREAPTARRDRRRVQGPHPPDPARASWPRPRPTTCSCPQVVYGYFPANGDGDDLVIWKDDEPHRRVAALPLPPPEQGRRSCASPTSSARSTSGEVDYAAFHIVTMGQRVSASVTAKLFADEQVPGVPAAARPRRRDGRGARRVLAPPHPRGVGLRRRGRPSARRPVPPAVPRRPLLVGLPGLPRPRGQREGAPSCSTPAASASRSARRPASSTSPSRPPRAIICHHPKAKYFVAR